MVPVETTASGNTVKLVSAEEVQLRDSMAESMLGKLIIRWVTYDRIESLLLLGLPGVGAEINEGLWELQVPMEEAFLLGECLGTGDGLLVLGRQALAAVANVGDQVLADHRE